MNSCPRLSGAMAVERALSHRLAHDLNNSLGAVDVFADMLIEDLGDTASPDILARIDKIKLAAAGARRLVLALRRGIPKHDDDAVATNLGQVFETVALMLGDKASRLRPGPMLGIQADVPVAVMVHVIHDMTAHVLACVPGDVAITVTQTGTGATITMMGDGAVVPLLWDRSFWDNVLAAFGLRLEEAQEGPAHGFALHCPNSSV